MDDPREPAQYFNVHLWPTLPVSVRGVRAESPAAALETVRLHLPTGELATPMPHDGSTYVATVDLGEPEFHDPVAIVEPAGRDGTALADRGDPPAASTFIGLVPVTPDTPVAYAVTLTPPRVRPLGRDCQALPGEHVLGVAALGALYAALDGVLNSTPTAGGG